MGVSTPAFSSRLTSSLRVAGLGLGLMLLTSTASQAQTWMVSTDAFMKLGVMDKFGSLGTYTAKFVVTNNTSGKTYFLTKEIASGQNGIDVVFPSEPTEADYFKAESGEAARALPGPYTWECQVSGKKVVGGKFSFPETFNDVTTLVADKKK
ncbi:hypothetical protein MTX78_06595 [Hymenobacter tibetensis]|uniref:Blue (type 1) copper domain-containing protein n=1 Tax=Hymenobacter tibetensis TaxID=497967 RepID=A0ABY4D221_9BACT|nr:hypothetical protein [Hymenobacter tibetensis]UOG76262.1 hypothetical protein MTX78_06595 [Hymenobacter tibetensis]